MVAGRAAGGGEIGSHLPRPTRIRRFYGGGVVGFAGPNVGKQMIVGPSLAGHISADERQFGDGSLDGLQPNVLIVLRRLSLSLSICIHDVAEIVKYELSEQTRHSIPKGQTGCEHVGELSGCGQT